MALVRQRAIRLPGGLHLTILHLAGALDVASLRSMLVCDWYVLAGPTHITDENGEPVIERGFGLYTGTTDQVTGKVQRAGVSLHNWSTTGRWRLRPQIVVLVEAKNRAVDPHVRLVVEARLTRALSADGWTILNRVTSAPTARKRCSRQQRRWADHTAERLAGSSSAASATASGVAGSAGPATSSSSGSSSASDPRGP